MNILIREVTKIKISVKESEAENFPDELKIILNDPEFNADNDLTIIKSKKHGKERFTTQYTMLDEGDVNPPLLFVFGKEINNRQIYIKLIIKTDRARHILCLSFHYAEERMNLPYA